jgi:hypothetical protein
MARRQGTSGDILDFTSTPRWRSAVFWASISFVVFHCIAMGTAPLASDAASDPNSDLLRQLIHFTAVFCRFTLPLILVVGGLVANLKTKRDGKLPRAANADAYRNRRR